MENPNYKKLIKVLEEVFQLNQADLDFGIYRIMNYKREEILKFLHEDLIPQVKEILSDNLSGDKTDVQKELDEAIKAAQGLGMNPDDSPKVQQLRQQLTGAADIEAEENAVFAQLANFFKRYYEGGDFISLRRYKEGVYAIPYEGEEVKLHWANHDQYYIKTSEYFKNYAFKLSEGKSVRFLLADASTEQNNNKTGTGKERRFALHESEPIKVNGDELQLFFTYAPTDKKLKQDALLKTAFEQLKTQIPAEFQEVLVSNAQSKTDKQKNRTVLEKHLRDYTARNTFDYFIHKNLGKFLRQELDFFIKNEVLFLDDINTRDTNDFVRQLSQVRALKSIGLKIIAFLEQLENFQKKLWLKKKFVVETQYCITLDRVPKELYPEIITNQAQIEEWKNLFHIQDIKKEDKSSKELFENNQVVAYSDSMTIDFLNSNPFLVLDTQFFSEDFKCKVVASMENMDEHLDGILVNSENFQALNLLSSRYQNKIKCIYIDPPYNTSASEIIYKNNYKNSSWISLLNDRLKMSKGLLNQSGILCCTIDDYEHKNLGLLMEQIFEELAGTVAIRIKPSGRPIPNGFAISHEYALFARKNSETTISRLSRNERQLARYREQDEEGRFFWEMLRKAGSNSTSKDRPTMHFPLYMLSSGVLRLPNMTYNPKTEVYEDVEPLKKNEIEILPIKDNGLKGCWYFGFEKMAVHVSKLKAVKQDDGKYFVYYRRRPNEGVQPTSVWIDAKYSATEHGTALIKKMFKTHEIFSYPKSIYAVQDSLKVSGLNKQSYVLDYFAGSGTTGHAVINFNREDNGKRKYILVEMGKYFNSVTKPRIQKVIYSENWKDGKPIDRKGSSHCFKYIRLESYEDTLNNLALNKAADTQNLALQENRDFREGYMLNYLLDTAVKDSLLNVSDFEDPFNYYLNITRQNEMTPTKVDMVETFNYLIGLVVERMDTIRGFRVVEGKSLQEEQILIIWRNTKEQDNKALNSFFKKMGYSTRDQEFHRIYVNGDNNLENLRTEEDRWKVVMIEEEFMRRMFEVEDV